nr:Uncharacterised protein [Vibrio cholerae]
MHLRTQRIGHIHVKPFQRAIGFCPAKRRISALNTKTHRFPFFGLRYPTDCCGN